MNVPWNEDMNQESDPPLFHIKFSIEQWKVVTIKFALVCGILSIVLVGLLLLPFIFMPAVAFIWMYRRRQCYVTRKNIVFRAETPVFFFLSSNTVERAVPLQKITDITLEQDWCEKIFGLARLNIETAGHSGFDQNTGKRQADLELVGVDYEVARDYKKRILELAGSTTSQINLVPVQAPQVAAENPHDAEMVHLLRDMVSTLRRIEERQTM